MRCCICITSIYAEARKYASPIVIQIARGAGEAVLEPDTIASLSGEFVFFVSVCIFARLFAVSFQLHISLIFILFMFQSLLLGSLPCCSEVVRVEFWGIN